MLEILSVDFYTMIQIWIKHFERSQVISLYPFIILCFNKYNGVKYGECGSHLIDIFVRCIVLETFGSKSALLFYTISTNSECMAFCNNSRDICPVKLSVRKGRAY